MKTLLRFGFLLGLLCLFFNPLAGQNSDKNFSYGSKGKYKGSVEIDYVLIADGYVASLKNLDPAYEINLQKYPDAYIRIHIKNLILEEEKHYKKYQIYLTKTSVPHTIRGYKVRKFEAQFLTKKSEIMVNYDQKPETRRDTKLRNKLHVHLTLKAGDKGKPIKHSSKPYRFKRPVAKKKKPVAKPKKKPKPSPSKVYIPKPTTPRKPAVKPSPKPEATPRKVAEAKPAVTSRTARTSKISEKEKEKTNPPAPFKVFYKRTGTRQVKIYFSGHDQRIPEMKFLRGEKEKMITSWQRDTLVLELPQKEKVKILFTETTHNQREELELNLSIEQLIGQLAYQDYLLNVSNVRGGEPPYVLMLEQNGHNLKSFSFGGQDTMINLLTLMQNDVLNAGTSIVKLMDSRKKEVAKSSVLVLQPLAPGMPWWLSQVLIAFGIILTGFFIYRRYQKDQSPDPDFVKDLEGLQYNNDRNENGIPAVKPTKPSLAKKRIIVNQTKRQAYELTAASTVLALGGGEDYFLSNSGDYFPCPLSDIWDNTQVSEVYMHKRFATRLNNFVFDENEILHFKKQEIPEIGGFLLGRKIKDSLTGKYKVSLERFVDIVPEENGVYQISFGMQAWQRLDTQLDAYQEEGFELVGWFHTHPGHGLFLSRPDLSIHESFFTKPYQLAMELDSLEYKNNEGFKYTFFTRDTKGEINSTQNETGSSFDWLDVKSWLKTV